MIDYDNHGGEDILSGQGRGATFAEIMQRRLTRRDVLKGAAAAATLVVTGAVANNMASASGPEQTDTNRVYVPLMQVPPPRPLNFTPIAATERTVDQTVVPTGYTSNVLLRWGDPITADGPDFDPANQSKAAQEQQFGYNCDFVGFMPLPLGATSSSTGLLVVNHEYTNPNIMFSDYQYEFDNQGNLIDILPTQAQVDVEIAAHGVSVVEIERGSDNTWTYKKDSTFNKRYTASETSIMTITGPAATHEWLQTSADPTGLAIAGTLNNCAAGKTPWGTVVTAEENFHQYFANTSTFSSDDPRKAVHERYGMPSEASQRRWERFHTRFDVTQEPNEAFRFGWAVEIDPYNPNWQPRKRSWLGRVRHEAQTFVVTPSGRVAVYSGDDERFEYVYKFVTQNTYSATDRAANLELLDSGMLYVAKFNDDGTGEWMPLEFGTGPLTAANGFSSQGDVLIKTRLAGDALGATKMDRPEDIETNPVTKKVYIALTNNTRRGTDGNEGTDTANPREVNRFGHIIELTEANDDHTATTFTWNIFMLCGDPADESTFFAGYDKSLVSKIANPDNFTFDNVGNLWVATDGQPSTLDQNDGLYAVPVQGSERGYIRQFFSSVASSEVCGPEFTPDNTSLFVAIQHPGETFSGRYEDATSRWPDSQLPPRPSVVVIQANDGSVVGQV